MHLDMVGPGKGGGGQGECMDGLANGLVNGLGMQLFRFHYNNIIIMMPWPCH